MPETQSTRGKKKTPQTAIAAAWACHWPVCTPHCPPPAPPVFPGVHRSPRRPHHCMQASIAGSSPPAEAGRSGCWACPTVSDPATRLLASSARPVARARQSPADLRPALVPAPAALLLAPEGGTRWRNLLQPAEPSQSLIPLCSFAPSHGRHHPQN